jgi:16S rRNA (cytosine967-C5)-methyltransferase
VHPAQIAHERDDRIKRLAGKIDRVLVDAPCSGLGTLRRNPDLKWRQSPKAVEELQAKQTAILASAARLLKPGGRLVYATCSLLAQRTNVWPRPSRRARARLRALPMLPTVLAAARVRTRPSAGGRALPAAVAASAPHRRLFRRRLAKALTVAGGLRNGH